MIGRTFGHYEIQGKLGQGGMGEVYEALDKRLGRRIALKVLPEELRDNPAARQRLQREARSAAILDHPFVCKIYEAAEHEGQLYIAMEYVDGRTLLDRLSEGPLPLKELLVAATEIAEALEVAHEHGIVHRDLKPANIMIGRSGHIKVMDFGLAKRTVPLFGGESRETIISSVTAPGTIVGTIDYMSPEQLRGQNVDARSDIFSFGIVLYECLTGSHPFRRGTTADTASAILAQTSVTVSRQSVAAPPLLSHIIRKALAREPRDRYQTVREMVTDLRLVRTEGASESGRRLAAIMLTDIVGHSAITQRNEALAMQLLEEHWRLLRPIFARHEGHEVKTIGDAFLVEFASALQATECAVEIQRALHERNAATAQDRQIVLRIGLHLGDVIHQENDVFGDGVNIAARIEPLAEPGGICVSEDVAHQVRNKIDLPVVELEQQLKLKNIARPIRAYSVTLPWVEPKPTGPGASGAGVLPVIGTDTLTALSDPDHQAVPGTPAAPAPAAAAPEKEHRGQPLGRRWRWILSFGGAAVLAVLGFLIFSILSPKPVLSFTAHDWILIADFDNQTGDPLFDRSLSTALTISLEQSQHANVFPRSRTADALKRMGRQAGQKLDEPTGRELCVREKIRGLVVPGISKVGQQYSLGVRIIDPQTGDSVRSYLEEAADQNQILPKLGALAKTLRRDLGESLGAIRISDRDLRRVTTPSLEALKLFSDGVLLWSRGQFREAAQQQEAALKLDPDFAKAHNALGIYYSSFVFNDRVRAKEHFEKAVSLSDRVTERERQSIQIAFEGFQGNTQNALNLSRVYLQSYRDDMAMRYNYATALRDDGNVEEAISQYQEVLRVNPNHANSWINLATCYELLKNYSESLKAYRSAFALEPGWAISGNINHEYGFTLLVAGRITEAREVFEKALAGPTRPLALRSMALLDLYLGKYERAKKELEEALTLNVANKAALSEARNHLFLSIVLDGQGKDAARISELDKAQRNLEALPPQVVLTAWVGVAYARAGALQKATLLLERIQGQAQAGVAEQSASVSLLEGEIELAKGNASRAVEFLTAADQRKQSPFTIGALARAYKTAGDAAAATAQFEKFLAADNRSLGNESQQDWIAAHYHLGRLYQVQEQKEKARQLVDRLREIWKEADGDLRLLRDAQKLQSELGNN